MSSVFLSKDEKLPPPPPPDAFDNLSHTSPPPTPSKSSKSSWPAQLGSLPTPAPPESLSLPLSPTAPVDSAKPKKTNPLNDLIDTERAYVDHLTGIIRKVAAAWSRSNLPPSELDTMFRSIEAVYKANRSLLSKLKEIGTNPSSPKALGDLLMRWIDDLETPYSTYSSKFLCGFDVWDPVQSNPKLQPILVNFSSSNPQFNGALWTLDSLFLLPKGRLKYYKKLYGRLLKSTAPGRSDHKLLVGAVDKLDALLDTIEHRETVRVGGSDVPPPSQLPVEELEDEVVLDMRAQTMRHEPEPEPRPISPLRVSEIEPSSESSSARDSGTSGDRGRMSMESISTDTSRGSTATLSMPISDLERRLSTARTMDIFTMTHKTVKLQMTPPSLTYTREMRCSVDLVIRVTPRATGQEIVHRRGHIFLLSDLFLICERMSLEERATIGSSGPDMWLCYPPLAGKVLRVSDVPGSDTEMQVHIMRKETLTLSLESSQARDTMMKDFKDCIEFANSVGPVSKQPPPPVPQLSSMGGFPPRLAQSIPSNRPSPTHVGLPSAIPPKVASPVSRNASPPSSQASPGMESISSRTSSLSQQSSRSSGSGSISEQYARMPPSAPPQRMPSLHEQPPLQRLPSLHEQPPLQRLPSLHKQPPMPGNGSIGVGQVFRNPSMTSQYNAPYGSSAGRSGPPPPPPPMKGPIQPPYPGSPPRNTSAPPMQGNFPPPFNQPQPRAPFMDGPLPQRPPSEPPLQVHPPGRRSPSTRSLSGHQDRPRYNNMPPNAYPPNINNNTAPNNFMMRNNPSPSLNSTPLHAPQPRTMLPSATFNSAMSSAAPSFADPSPPNSPVEETSSLPTGPVTSAITATMKCKVFLKQQHAQWKSLGSAKLKLYTESPTNIKQLVVEEEKNNRALISTIVLTDGVERVGKTGVAVELSDRGARTGIIYMIQLRNEKSAGGLFDSLLEGSDRSR